MAKTFENKVILCTGAGSGIGGATSIKLSQLGATLALTDINGFTLSESLSLCERGDHFISPFDIGSTEACNNFIDAIIKKYGKINHIFNCAGINPTSLSTASITDEYYDKLLKTNLKGPFNITRACIPQLTFRCLILERLLNRRSPSNSRIRRLLRKQVRSDWVLEVHGVRAGTQGDKDEFYAPGYINTPTNANVVAGKESVEALEKQISFGRMGTPDEIADLVVFLFGDESQYMNESVVEINGAWCS